MDGRDCTRALGFELPPGELALGVYGYLANCLCRVLGMGPP